MVHVISKNRVIDFWETALHRRASAAAEARWAAASAALAERDRAVAALTGQADAAARRLEAVQAEYDAMRDELRAVTEDLHLLLRENAAAHARLEDAAQVAPLPGSCRFLKQCNAAEMVKLVTQQPIMKLNTKQRTFVGVHDTVFNVGCIKLARC